MIARLVLAIVVGIVTALACILVGTLLDKTGVPFLTTIGAFLVAWGWVLGLLAGLWHFFSGGTVFPR